MKVREYLSESIDKTKLQKYKEQFRAQHDKFFKSSNFPEEPFRCFHLKNKPVMTAEKCKLRAGRPKDFKECKGCKKFDKLVKEK